MQCHINQQHHNRLCGACYDTTTDHDAIRMRYLDDDNKIEISTPIDTLDAWNWWIWWLSPLRWLFIRTINIFITSISWHMCSLFRKQDREWLTYFIIIYCCFTILYLHKKSWSCTIRYQSHNMWSVVNFKSGLFVVESWLFYRIGGKWWNKDHYGYDLILLCWSWCHDVKFLSS